MKIFFLLFIILGAVSGEQNSLKIEDAVDSVIYSETDSVRNVYHSLNIENQINYDAFKLAYSGYLRLKKTYLLGKPNILTIIDYTRPSVEKRLFVINLNSKKILHTSLVAHGMNSGENYAVKFSNKSGSLQSSLGFYMTGKTYNGKHGYSLKLDGIESDINDRAHDRTIVIHGANYATENFIKKNGRLGRSWGCPALPPQISKKIIDTIKDGSCLFIYHSDQNYLKLSQIVNSSDL